MEEIASSFQAQFQRMESYQAVAWLIS
jgi:hypothetical protein